MFKINDKVITIEDCPEVAKGTKGRVVNSYDWTTGRVINQTIDFVNVEINEMIHTLPINRLVLLLPIGAYPLSKKEDLCKNS
jgi:hypothetical protein